MASSMIFYSAKIVSECFRQVIVKFFLKKSLSVISTFMVLTMTERWGIKPLKRHFRFRNFSKLMSAPKPLSVTW